MLIHHHYYAFLRPILPLSRLVCSLSLSREREREREKQRERERAEGGHSDRPADVGYCIKVFGSERDGVEGLQGYRATTRVRSKSEERNVRERERKEGRGQRNGGS